MPVTFFVRETPTSASSSPGTHNIYLSYSTFLLTLIIFISFIASLETNTFIHLSILPPSLPSHHHISSISPSIVY